MNEDTMNQENEDQEVMPDELTLLKQQADIMGVKYHPNIKLDKLKAKIESHKEAIEQGVKTVQEMDIEELDSITSGINLKEAKANANIVSETEAQRKMRLRKEANRLVRVRITNMNPLKSNLKGEIFSVGNTVVGFIKKYIPYNAENGWHIPEMMLNSLKERKFTTFYTVKINGKDVKRMKLIPELNIEILPPLTRKELEDLAHQQQIKGQG